MQFCRIINMPFTHMGTILMHIRQEQMRCWKHLSQRQCLLDQEF